MERIKNIEQERINVDKEIMEGLKGFDEVWKRVSAARPENEPRSGGTAELMPRKKPQSRAVRFCPPQK